MKNARLECWQIALAIFAVLSASVVVADDFKTVSGKEYKNATLTRVEPDGIVLQTESGISKVYFVELPEDVQARFHYDPQQAGQYIGRQQQEAVLGKAQSIRIPYIEFRDTTIPEAIDFLREQAAENDPGGTGVIISTELDNSSLNASPRPRITLSLQDVTLFEAVTAVARQIGLSVRAESYGLVIYRENE